MHVKSDKFNVSMTLFTCIFYVLSPRTVHIKLPNFVLFSLENDDMEASKRFTPGPLLRLFVTSMISEGLLGFSEGKLS